ncbi:hypothetical protein PB01_18750 [Psychrobacillus glaciei]|uniref:Uncharacterized protein n=1 Tax=Psychrobacillus glaciei TaxID=2283160 RepID=A0A5J6SWC9_9BACI|nr:hypothetical protein [Psychrobacillus glaciei]QFG00668.1 hypothetical protein PB01_18750 [Psychrobacillus glaciei]
MGTLTLKEQVLLAYYTYNFLEEKAASMQELENTLKNALQNEYTKTLEDLKREGLVNNSQDDGKERTTNEGILYMDNTLHINSDATERNKLAYVKDSLLINEMVFSNGTLKEYIHKHVGID